MTRLFKNAVKYLISSCPRRARILVGRVLSDQALGDNNGNSETNGEYYFLKQALSLRPGPKNIFDVGANVGDWSLAAERFLGDNSYVYAFEPVKLTFAALLSKSMKKIKPFNLALGKSDGESVIYTSTDYAGTNSLVLNEYVGHSGKSEKVQVISGTTFCKKNQIEHVDILKIDTEGYELSVLAGFDEMLEEGKIDFIQFEYGGTWIYSRSFLKDAFELLQKRGYAIAKLHPDFLEGFEHYDPKSETFLYSNWIAFRKGMAVPMRIVPHA